MALPVFDDIDIDVDPEDEARILLAADGEEKEDEKEEIAEAEPAVEKEEVIEPEDDAVARAAAELEEVRQERIRLQEQLNELTVRSALDGRKLAELERDLTSAKQAPPAPKVEEGPTPEEVLSHLDQRIAIVDAKLAKAELEDPSAAPPLRAQLRQLERYFADYKANVLLASAKGPDPDVLVQQAAEEAQQQARFSNVRNAVTQEYPNLDPRAQYFNPELRDMVHEIYNPMLAQGADPTEALIKATTLVMRANGIPSVSEYNQQQAALAAQQAAASPPAPAAPPPRQKEAIAKNVAAATAIPPDISALGNSNKSEGLLGKYDFSKMDIKEFMRLTDEDEERIESALSMYEE